MADAAVLDPLPYGPTPNPPSYADPFDAIHFPDDFPSDFQFPPDIDFDGDIEFSIDDLLDFPELDSDTPPPATDPPASSSSGEGSGVSSSSPVSGTHVPAESADLDRRSPDSGNSVTCGAISDKGVKVEDREERKGRRLKRKKEREDGDAIANPISSSDPRSGKFRRSVPFEEVNSPCMLNMEGEEDEKRKARLMRNRESAQLSRQRKKHYVEELEEKVKKMNSMISELNGKISYIMAENVGLRQQLGTSGKGNSLPVPPPGVYPAVAPMHYPWIPGYAVRPPGAHVPLIPIPRLKPQPSSSTSKSKKSESKRSESRTKKVASVSLLGLLFFLIIVGVFVPRANFRQGEYMNLISNRHIHGTNGIFGYSHGRVLTVTGNFGGSNQTWKTGLLEGNMGYRKANADNHNGHKLRGDNQNQEAKPKEGSSSHTSSCTNGSPIKGNATEPLLCSLYVPRNDKLVKIDGNLIISSVLASEQAMATVKTSSSGQASKETSLAVAHSTSSALAVSNSGKHSHALRSLGEHPKALPYGSTDKIKENLKSNPIDGPLKEWFREGFEGPVFSSGMCTEVFLFDASPSANHGGIVPAASVANITNVKAKNSTCPAKMKNRKAMYHDVIPHNGSALNNTESGFVKHPENSSFHSGKKPSKSMVVSVLVDPREVGDSEGDNMISSKSISRIFVVVLVDSVKYVTYSCALPFKSNAQHLVTV